MRARDSLRVEARSLALHFLNGPSINGSRGISISEDIVAVRASADGTIAQMNRILPFVTCGVDCPLNICQLFIITRQISYLLTLKAGASGGNATIGTDRGLLDPV